MPNIKAAEKWSRQSEKRTIRNKDANTRLKTLYKKAAASSDAAAMPEVESAFDKAATKGIIHPNKAARKKSRLAKAVRTPSSAKTAKTKATKSTKPARSTRKK